MTKTFPTSFFSLHFLYLIFLGGGLGVIKKKTPQRHEVSNFDNLN